MHVRPLNTIVLIRLDDVKLFIEKLLYSKYFVYDSIPTHSYNRGSEVTGTNKLIFLALYMYLKHLYKRYK